MPRELEYPATARILAALSDSDPRTADKWLQDPDRVRPLTARRLRRAYLRARALDLLQVDLGDR